LFPSSNRNIAHEVAEASTTDPNTGACKSPTTSSSENSTAASGVLNAAAIAAVAPTGSSAFTFSVRSPSHLPSTEAIPAPTCAADRHQQPAQHHSRRALQLVAKAFRQQNERHDRQAHQCANHQCRNQEHLPFAVPQDGRPLWRRNAPPAFGGWSTCAHGFCFC